MEQPPVVDSDRHDTCAYRPTQADAVHCDAERGAVTAKRWAAAAVGSVLLAGGLLRHRLARFEISEHSMAPALLPGDFVLAARLGGSIRRGTIVVFEHPERSGFDLVKRVIGMPGERLEIGRGQVHIGDSVLPEPWADGPTLGDGALQLGEREIFVLGDRRADSAGDSRATGPLPLDQVEWRVLGRYWPPARAGRLSLK
jgi:signal peptidase I